jgi:hypothetical protein
MESMSACQSSDIIIILNGVEADSAGISRVGQEIRRHGFTDMVTILVAVKINVQVFIGQRMLPFFSPDT